MTAFTYPGVYIDETTTAGAIAGVGTSTPLFVGQTESEFSGTTPFGASQLVTNFSEYKKAFMPANATKLEKELSKGIYGFFQNGGTKAWVLKTKDHDADTLTQALEASEAIPDEVSLVCSPGVVEIPAQNALIAHCEKVRTRFGILDEPLEPAGAGVRTVSSFAATYYPRLAAVGGTVHPSGYVAGVYARSDATRGVHKAPANEPVLAVSDVEVDMSDTKQGDFNNKHVNVIRNLPGSGITVWGARTLDTKAGSQYKYVNVRRLMIYIEQSLRQGLRWVVFEPNDTGLWKSVERIVTAFLTSIWRDGGLFGATAKEAFFIKVNEENNTAETRQQGELHIEIGVAPVRPAEFVVIHIGISDNGSSVG